MLVSSYTNGGSGTGIPAGSYKGRITGVFDVGTHDGMSFDPGEPAKPRRQLIVQFELHKGDSIHVSHKFYTASFHPKSSFRKDVEAIEGRSYSENADFDPATLLGVGVRAVVVNETKNGRTSDKITTVMGLDPGEPVPKSARPLTSLDLDVEGFEVDPAIPAWIVTRAGSSPEWAKNSRMTGPSRETLNERKIEQMIATTKDNINERKFDHLL